MSIRTCLIAVCLVAAAAWVIAQETLPAGAPAGANTAGADPAAADPLDAAPPTDARHYSYFIGFQIGSSFCDDEMTVDADSLLAGLKDGLAEAKPQYDEELMAVAVERMYREQQQKAQRRAAIALKDGEAFLAANAKAPGVVTLPSGLQYKVLASGTGPSPKATDVVRVNYRGTFLDGKMFDESGDQPAVFPVDRVIDGWTEALQLMKVGDKWQLAVPSKLAYGPDGRDGIPPDSTLVFEVELLGIEGQ